MPDPAGRGTAPCSCASWSPRGSGSRSAQTPVHPPGKRPYSSPASDRPSGAGPLRAGASRSRSADTRRQKRRPDPPGCLRPERTPPSASQPAGRQAAVPAGPAGTKPPRPPPDTAGASAAHRSTRSARCGRSERRPGPSARRSPASAGAVLSGAPDAPAPGWPGIPIRWSGMRRC